MPVSQTAYDARLKKAIIQRATRTLMLPGAPLGHWGEMTEMGFASVRPDFETRELLAGMMFQPIGNLEALVTTDDVIRVGLQTDPAGYPETKVGDVQDAIGAACSWIEDYLREGVALA